MRRLVDVRRSGEIGQELDSRILQLQPHHAGDRAADRPRDDREDQVQRANVLVVGRHEPTREETGLVVVMRRVRRIVMSNKIFGAGRAVSH